MIGLSADELLDEKIGVHLEKTAKGTSEIQDLYDIWILKDRARVTKAVKSRLDGLVQATRKGMPSNSGSLRALILSGVAPSPDQMLDDLMGVAVAD